MDLYIEGDWTTYEGLSAEQDYEPVVFGKKAASKPAGARKSPAKPKEDKRINFRGVAAKGIDKKKKKAPRAAGLMKNREEEEVEEEMEEETFSAPSPYIKSSKNKFAALGAIMDAEEAEAEAEERAKAKAEADAANNVGLQVANAIGNFVREAGKTPVARRTRTAFKGIGDVMQGVVNAVASPFIERMNSKENAEPAAKEPAAAKAKAKAPPVAAPVRRSTRLR